MLVLLCSLCFVSFHSFLTVPILTGPSPAFADEDSKPPTIAEKTQGLDHKEGLFDLYLDHDAGKAYLRLPAPKQGSMGQYLYYEGLASGLGSNPVGLDRNQLGNTRLVEFRHVGGRVLVEQPNLQYRALSDNAAERAATRQSFATSILWATDVVARDAYGEVLIDFTSFLMRDEHGIAKRLEDSDQGSFSLDSDRSVLDVGNCWAFPDNVAFEALLTFAGSSPGGEVRATAPDPKAVTLRLHHSLVRLPDAGYTPRAFDPRIGAYAVDFADYAAPLDQPIETKWIVRHRLEKTDPSAARSTVKEPIVYYVDRGVPEPVRSALLDGARWWAEAFEEAGFIDAFRVEVLPEDAHPLDVRYNVINWVHRATRGWSYGWGVIDPRTGEMIKGHVLLGSLRVRQDRLLFEGLAGVEKTGSGEPDDPVQLALARIRQLSAHEIGHTLGVAHNFAASTYGRESVMDYPAPYVRVNGDKLDFSQAYDVGIGDWDKQTIRYAYSQFAPGTDEAAALEEIVQDGLAKGLYFVTDADARPPGAANPRGNLWDNGETAEQALEEILQVRRLAMKNFGEHNIAKGRPLALLQEVFAPVYFMHRYSLDAAAKVLGGVDYHYAMRGDGQPKAQAISRQRQERALELLLSSLRPNNLDIPETTLAVMLPRPFGYGRNRELFASGTQPVFDALGAAATAARMTAKNIFQAERCARLIDQHRRDSSLPGLEEVAAEVLQAVFTPAAGSSRTAEIRRATQAAVLEAMLELARDADTPVVVRTQMEETLRQLAAKIEGTLGQGRQKAHRRWMLDTLQRFFERGMEFELPEPVASPPPGSPIGCAWD